jgi:hypothetical protein
VTCWWIARCHGLVIAFNARAVGERRGDGRRLLSYNLAQHHVSAYVWHHVADTLQSATATNGAASGPNPWPKASWDPIFLRSPDPAARFETPQNYSLLERFMSVTIKNGSITLTNFAELGSVLDPQTLPPGPEVANGQPTSGSGVTQEAGAAQTIASHDLASLLAQLSTISTGLDAMARQDAYARDQAARDVARYEALLVDKQEADRALAEVRRLRAAAEQLAAEAFTDEARAQAAQHAAGARAAELHVTQLLAERTRDIEELAARPHLARALADRQRHAEQMAEADQRAEAERANRLNSGLAALHQTLAADQLDEAQRLLEPLVREFPDNAEVHKRADALRWRLRQRLVAPAETALQEVVRRPTETIPRRSWPAWPA